MLEYLKALWEWWWVFVIGTPLAVLAAIADCKKLRRRFTRPAWIALLLSSAAVAQGLAWFDMRAQRDALERAGPRLTLDFRGQDLDGSLRMFVRNEGYSPAVLRFARTCDTTEWAIIDQEDGRAIPHSAYPGGPGGLELSLALGASTSSFGLVCDADRMRLLPIQGKKKTVAANGGTLELHLTAYPERWTFNPYEGYGRGGNDLCPIELISDHGVVLLARLCTDKVKLEEAKARAAAAEPDAAQ